MKGVVLMVFLLYALHSTQATLDILENIELVKRNAANNFHTISGELAKNIADLTKQAKTKFQDAIKTPLNKLLQYKDLVPSLDFGKVKDLYASKKAAKQKVVNNVLQKKEQNIRQVKQYLQSTLSAKGKEKTKAYDSIRVKQDYLREIFEGKYPYPVVTRKIVYIYD